MSRPIIDRYSRVPETFWLHAVSWRDDMKLAALYFVTCRHKTVEGIFILPVEYVSADLKWTAKKVRKAIAFLVDAEFLCFDPMTNIMLIRNALKYQAPENDNQAKSCLRRIVSLPNTELVAQFLLLAKQHCYRTGASPFAQSFYQQLEQQLGKQFTEPFPPLNLNLKSEILNLKPTILNLKQRRPH